MKKTLAILASAILAIFMMVSCNSKPEGLIGDWKYVDGNYTYHFKADSTGSYDPFWSSFTYSDNGKELKIFVDGKDNPWTIKYRIEDDKFIVTDDFGEDVVYIRQ